MNAAERAGYGDLDLLARRLSAIHPDVRDFAAYAMAEIDGLRKRLVFSEAATIRLGAAAAAADGHIDRQAVLLREQAEQLARAHAHLMEIAGMCDLADWSSHAGCMPAPATVLVDDLRSVLRKASRAAISLDVRDERAVQQDVDRSESRGAKRRPRSPKGKPDYPAQIC